MIEIVTRNVESDNAARRVHHLASRLRDVHPEGTLSAAIRAAKAKDPHVLHVLESMAERAQAATERAFGRTLREGAHRGTSPEAAMWREAYTAVDRGSPQLDPFMYQIAAAAIHAGVIDSPAGV